MYIPFIPNVIDARSERWLALFRQHLPDYQIAYLQDIPETAKQHIEVAIVANPKQTELQELPSLKWLHSTWAGVEKVLPTAQQRGLPLARMQDPMLATVMAEAVLTWCLYVYRRIPCYQSQQHQQQWQQLELPNYQDFTVAILGMGNMGLASCRLLQQIGFNVIGWGRSAKSAMSCDYYYGESQLDIVLAQADVVVVLLPLTHDTTGLITEKQLARMKSSAALINFGRAAVVEQQALAAALKNNAIYHAVLDVFEEEPLPAESDVWHWPNATILPHVAAPTNPDTASRMIANNIKHYVTTGEMPQCVDPKRGY